jgi:hypothetical protein
MGKGGRAGRWLIPLQDLVSLLEATLVRSPRPWRSMAILLGAVAGTWILYVPIHELLHAAGCLLSGGEVRTVRIGSLYGGAILERVIPVVQAGGEYAGRLAGFSTGRSDTRYLITVAAPYILSIAAVPLLRRAIRAGSPWLGGLALVPAFAPIYSLPGDYFEMGSILVTRAVSPLEAPPEPYSVDSGLMLLRSDDLVALLGRLSGEPHLFTPGTPGGLGGVIMLLVLSILTSIALAALTYLAGHQLSRGRPAGEGPVRLAEGTRGP